MSHLASVNVVLALSPCLSNESLCILISCCNMICCAILIEVKAVLASALKQILLIIWPWNPTEEKKQPGFLWMLRWRSQIPHTVLLSGKMIAQHVWLIFDINSSIPWRECGRAIAQDQCLDLSLLRYLFVSILKQMQNRSSKMTLKYLQDVDEIKSAPPKMNEDPL